MSEEVVSISIESLQLSISNEVVLVLSSSSEVVQVK